MVIPSRGSAYQTVPRPPSQPKLPADQIDLWNLRWAHAQARIAARKGNLQEARAQSAEVKIDNFSFGSPELTVSVGTTVTWTNRDDIPHTVTGSDDPKLFKTKVLDTDEKFSFTFTKAGTYPYFCSIHPKMTAKVIVQ